MSESLALGRNNSVGFLGVVRAAVRATVFVAITSVLYVTQAILVPLLDRLGGRGFKFSTWIVRWWAGITCRILGIRIHVKGTPPEAPFLLVSNHTGYVDVLVLASQLDCSFVAKADAASWPVFGSLCRAGGTIFLNRERARQIPVAMRQMDHVMKRGRGVVLFAEGKSSNGAELLPFRSSLLAVAARADMPVSYASLTYETPPGSPSARNAVCWWDDTSLVTHLRRLASLPGFDATLVFGDTTVHGQDRKDLATRLHQSVRSIFRPVTP